jgi:NADH-quinone oxidoreductase subunit I
MGNGVFYVKMTLEAAKGICSALGVVLRHLFKKKITEEYPEYKRPLPARSRARIILTRDPEGEERCVACFLCAAACPVCCISMEAEEREDGRRFAPWFRINFARCIYCGLCEEACPTLAIQLTPDFEWCNYDVLTFVAEKEDLLVDHGGKNREYNFYHHAGVDMVGAKGTHFNESKPVNLKSNLP